MDWGVWAATVSDARQALSSLAEELEGVEDDAAVTLRDADDQLAEVQDLLETRRDEHDKMEAEEEAREAAEEEASIVHDDEEDEEETEEPVDQG